MPAGSPDSRVKWKDSGKRPLRLRSGLMGTSRLSPGFGFCPQVSSPGFCPQVSQVSRWTVDSGQWSAARVAKLVGETDEAR